MNPYSNLNLPQAFDRLNQAVAGLLKHTKYFASDAATRVAIGVLVKEFTKQLPQGVRYTYKTQGRVLSITVSYGHLSFILTPKDIRSLGYPHSKFKILWNI